MKILPEKLDLIDRKIVAALQRDGRQTHGELAIAVGLSQSACHRRVQRLQENGIIAGYSAIIDRTKVGLKVMGFVSVKMESHDAKMLEKFVQGVDAIEAVVDCYAISGGGDYLLRVVAADMESFSEVALKQLVRLPGVKDSTTTFVLSTIKQKAALPL